MKKILLTAVVCAAMGSAWAEKLEVFPPAKTVEEKIALAERTLEYVKKSVSSEKLDKLAAELAFDKDWWTKAKSEGEKYACERAIMSVRRRILFQHPDLQFKDLLAVQRGFPFAEEPGMTDQYMGRWSRPGPGLVAIRNWKSVPRKKVLLEGKLPTGCTLNPCLHWDADKVIFAFNDHERPAPADPRKVHVPPLMHRNADGSLRQPLPDEIRESDPDNPNINPTAERDEFSCVHHRYFIYEAAVDGSWVKQLTGTPSDPMTTPDGLATSLIEDVDPCYLPDGGFVFCSTRAQNYGRCHWGRYVASFLLYRADGDGGNISQFSFAEANEWRPEMLPDGRLVYTRWDYVDRYAAKFAGLWVVRPDGTAVDIIYGNYSDTMRSCAAAHPVPGTRQIVAVAGAHHMFTTGTLVIIDPLAGEDGEEPLTRLTPDTGILESEGWYQKGGYTDPMPVNDTLFFASYSADSFGYPKDHPHDSVPNIRAHWQNPRSYGVWLVDRLGGRELIYQDPEWSTFNPTPIVKRAKPPALASSLPPPAEAPDTGLFYLRNVYDCRQPIPPGSIKAIRVNRLHNMHPCRRGGTFRQSANYAYHKEPLGTVPVSPDGSAYFRLPAEVPIQLQAIDANGMAVMTMRSAIYTRKGEIQGCAGCHERKSNAAPVDGRLKGREPDVPVPEVDLGYKGPFSYVKSVQPVFDRNCIRCHGLKEGGRPMSLVGTNGLFNLVYDEWDLGRGRLKFRKGDRQLISMAISYQETNESKPYDYFAAASRLTKMVRGGHGGAKLTPDELQTLILWMDLNVTPFSPGGGYSWNRPELNGIDEAGEKALRSAVLARWGMARANEPIEALVNRACPAKSRVLLAALPAAAGGWGQWEKPFTGKDDPEYLKFEKLVEGAIRRSPWHDIRGTCGRDDKCECNSCWIRLGGYNDPKVIHGAKKIGD